MKLLTRLLVSFMLLLQLLGCNNAIDNSPTDQIYYINADNNQEIIDLKLSDLADDFRFIKLETTENSLISDLTTYYIGQNYVLAYTQDGIYKFSQEGKFIKKLINQGHGPQELALVAGFNIFVVDEKNDLLYIDDQMRRKELLVYDIQSERFLNPVKKWLPGFGQFAIYNDSLIVRSVFSRYNDSINYAVYIQNLKGDLISGVTHNKKIINNRNNDELFQPSILSIGNNDFHVYFTHDDTLFQIKENNLAPYLIMNFDKPRDNPPYIPGKNGDRNIFYSEVEAPSFIIIDVSVLEERVEVTTDAVISKTNNNFFFFNKSTGIGSNIRSYTDDLINKTQLDVNLQKVFFGGASSLVQILTNGKLVVCYNQYEINEAVENGLNYIDFPKSLNEQLLKINEEMKEMDNPVLLVGMIKKEL